jgi:hypothetical protein
VLEILLGEQPVVDAADIAAIVPVAHVSPFPDGNVDIR